MSEGASRYFKSLVIYIICNTGTFLSKLLIQVKIWFVLTLPLENTDLVIIIGYWMSNIGSFFTCNLRTVGQSSNYLFEVWWDTGSFLHADPLSHFSFKPVLYNYNYNYTYTHTHTDTHTHTHIYILSCLWEGRKCGKGPLSDSKRGILLPPHGLLFLISSKGSLYPPSHRQDNTYTAFVTPVVEHWMEWEIAQWVHHEGSIQRPITPWANALTTDLHLTLPCLWDGIHKRSLAINQKE